MKNSHNIPNYYHKIPLRHSRSHAIPCTGKESPHGRNERTCSHPPLLPDHLQDASDPPRRTHDDGKRRRFRPHLAIHHAHGGIHGHPCGKRQLPHRLHDHHAEHQGRGAHLYALQQVPHAPREHARPLRRQPHDLARHARRLVARTFRTRDGSSRKTKIPLQRLFDGARCRLRVRRLVRSLRLRPRRLLHHGALCLPRLLCTALLQRARLQRLRRHRHRRLYCDARRRAAAKPQSVCDAHAAHRRLHALHRARRASDQRGERPSEPLHHLGHDAGVRHAPHRLQHGIRHGDRPAPWTRQFIHDREPQSRRDIPLPPASRRHRSRWFLPDLQRAAPPAMGRLHGRHHHDPPSEHLYVRTWHEPSGRHLPRLRLRRRSRTLCHSLVSHAEHRTDDPFRHSFDSRRSSLPLLLHTLKYQRGQHPPLARGA